jgi:FkbM family methyltransferase
MNVVRPIAQSIRRRFHPLHSLRKSWVYKNCLQPALDVTLQANLGFRKPVSIRFLSHFSYLFLAKEMEQSSVRAFTVISGLLDVSRQSVYDVGANIGLYTWCALDSNPGLQVAVFEPDPRNFSLLKDTAREWQANQARLFCNAVSKDYGMAMFSRDLLSSAAGTLEQGNLPFAQKHYRQQEEVIEVRKFPLDALWGKPGMLPPGLLKIDVEGHELEVLHGAVHTLEGSRPVIFVESFSEKSPALLEFIGKYGYTFYDADHIAPASPTTLNFLCLPKDGINPSMPLALEGMGFPVNEC